MSAKFETGKPALVIAGLLTALAGLILGISSKVYIPGVSEGIPIWIAEPVYLWEVIVVIGVILAVVGEVMPTAVIVSRICPACGKNLSNLPEDIASCPYCMKPLEPLVKPEKGP